MADLVLKRIKVKRASFVDNNIENKGQKYAYQPELTRSIGVIGENEYLIELSASIHSSEDKPFPFELDCSIAALFEISGADEEDTRNFLRINATQMIFPHLRSLVMSLTANCLVSPILLPIVSVNIFNDEDSKKKIIKQ